MKRSLMKSKIHRATVTGAHLHYMGSITVDKDLMEAVDLLPYERVHVLNLDNGARIETYVITGKKGSGQIRLNGAAARFFAKHDRVIIIAYADVDDQDLKQFQPRVVFVDEKNKLSELRIDRVSLHKKMPPAKKRGK